MSDEQHLIGDAEAKAEAEVFAQNRPALKTDADMADAFARASRSFERLPGPGMMRYAIGKLARAGVPEPAIRDWCGDVAVQYGIESYVVPNFEAQIWQPAMRLDQEAA